MEYLRREIKKYPDLKPDEKLDKYVEKYWSFVDDVILNENRIKCSWERVKINENVEIYKSTLKTIKENSASLSIYIPKRKHSYTLYFSYKTWYPKWIYNSLDDWTGLRIDSLKLDFNKLEIFNKWTNQWEYLEVINTIFKNELDWIIKLMYSDVFNNPEFNNNITEKDI